MIRDMANYVVNRVDLFPNGTVVKAFLREQWHQPQLGQPAGLEVGNATMTAGVAEITGLIAGREYIAYALVGGEDRTLAFQAPEPATLAAQTGAPEPQLQGLVGYDFDPALASGTFQLTPAGTLFVQRIPIKESCKISNILLWLATKGATLTAGQNFVGLLQEGTRKLLSASTAAEALAAFQGANGSLLTIPLVTPQFVGPGYVSAALFYNGTTAPTFGAAPASAAALINAGAAATASRFATADTGLTTAIPATAAALAAAAAPIWVGLN